MKGGRKGDKEGKRHGAYNGGKNKRHANTVTLPFTCPCKKCKKGIPKVG